MPSMPIHIRAEPGEYAEACLLPGDPLRAKYIAETYFDDVRQRNTDPTKNGHNDSDVKLRIVQHTGGGEGSGAYSAAADTTSLCPSREARSLPVWPSHSFAVLS